MGRHAVEYSGSDLINADAKRQVNPVWKLKEV